MSTQQTYLMPLQMRCNETNEFRFIVILFEDTKFRSAALITCEEAKNVHTE